MNHNDNDDDSDFKKAMYGVKPIKQDKHAHHRKNKKDSHHDYRKMQAQARNSELELNTPLPAANTLLDRLLPTDWVEGNDPISYVKSGVQAKQFKALKKGQILIESRLDLHHFTSDEALSHSTRFIENAKNQGMKCILLIHGKGYLNQEGKPILKNILNQWLPNHHDVIAFSTALPRDGGSGAIYVLLTGH